MLIIYTFILSRLQEMFMFLSGQQIERNTFIFLDRFIVSVDAVHHLLFFLFQNGEQSGRLVRFFVEKNVLLVFCVMQCACSDFITSLVYHRCYSRSKRERCHTQVILSLKFTLLISLKIVVPLSKLNFHRTLTRPPSHG